MLLIRAYCRACLEALRLPAAPTRELRGNLPVVGLHSLGNASTYRALRGWKKHRGIFTDRVVLSRERLERLRSAIRQELSHAPERLALVPIPQARHRSLALGGSPAYDLAEALVEGTSWQLSLALRVGKSGGPQASRSAAAERRLRAPQFEPGVRSAAGRAVLVDDFCTTGQTLLAAERALNRAGVEVALAVTLGVRRTPVQPATEPTPDPKRLRDNECAGPDW